MRALLHYQKHAEDFHGVNPDRGFFVNVYLRAAGTEYETLEPGNVWANRKEAHVYGRAQVKGTSDKLAYRVRVRPKGPIPRRPPPPRQPVFSHPFLHACPCMAQHMRYFR